MNEEVEVKNTPTEEAFRLAETIFPIRANSLHDPPTIKVERLNYKQSKLIELAFFINANLKIDDIKDSIERFCEDYNPAIDDYWFTAEGMKKFIKFCEPREKGLFD